MGVDIVDHFNLRAAELSADCSGLIARRKLRDVPAFKVSAAQCDRRPAQKMSCANLDPANFQRTLEKVMVARFERLLDSR